MPRRSLFGGMVGTDYDSNIWLSLHPTGLICISISYCIHFYAFYVLSQTVVLVHADHHHQYSSHLIFYLVYTPAAVLAVISLFRANTTNPGAVPLGARPFCRVKASGGGTPVRMISASSRSTRRCPKCGRNYKPDRAHHDSVTGRCIVKFDHYCPWINNAVGAKNHKYFCLFLFYTAVSCLSSLILLFLRLVECKSSAAASGGGDKDTVGTSSAQAIDVGGGQHFLRILKDNFAATAVAAATATGNNSALCALFSDKSVQVLAVVSLIFLVFTIAMGIEQIDAIRTGQGKIARMKQRVGNAGTEFQVVTDHCNEMFGGNSPNIEFHWFLPIPPRYPPTIQKLILGYDYDISFGNTVYVDPEEQQSDDTLSVASGASTSAAALSENQSQLHQRIRTPSADNNNNSTGGLQQQEMEESGIAMVEQRSKSSLPVHA